LTQIALIEASESAHGDRRVESLSIYSSTRRQSSRQIDTRLHECSYVNIVFGRSALLNDCNLAASEIKQRRNSNAVSYGDFGLMDSF
jgi:hypothetical protein